MAAVIPLMGSYVVDEMKSFRITVNNTFSELNRTMVGIQIEIASNRERSAAMEEELRRLRAKLDHLESRK